MDQNRNKGENISKCWSAEPFLSVEFTVFIFFVSKCLSEILETKTVSKCLSGTIMTCNTRFRLTWAIWSAKPSMGLEFLVVARASLHAQT